MSHLLIFTEAKTTTTESTEGTTTMSTMTDYQNIYMRSHDF